MHVVSHEDNNRYGSIFTYPHSSMQGPGDLVILLEAWAASKNLRQPELTNSTLHVANLALAGRGSLDPLGRLPPNTADHVGMGESLGGPLLWFRAE